MNKSNFMNTAEQMREKLGHALCLAKWQQVSLHLTTGMTNSCYHPPLHEIPIEPLKFYPGALHNTAHKKAQRKLMLEQQRPEECSYCWSAENNGQLSDRHYRSGEPWAAEHYNEIVNGPWDMDATPSYIEVNFNHACNLACSYCSPQFSSEWGKDVSRWGAYPTSNKHNDPGYFQGRRRPIPSRDNNPFLTAFWEWWPHLYGSLKHFRMTGGEPLMDKNTHRVFDYILAFPKTDLHVDVTSNFSVEPELFEKYLKKVKELCTDQRIEHFMQYVSLDSGIQEQAAYIRRGLDFNRVNVYTHRFLTEVPYRNSLTYIITMNNLNLLGLRRLLETILDQRKLYSNTYQRVWFDTPLLRQPTWQSLQILPESYCDVLEDVIEFMKENLMPIDSFIGFKDYEIQRMERNLVWMRQGKDLEQEYIVQQRADFYRFFNDYDKRNAASNYYRVESFLKTFPQMKEFWNECKWYAENR